MLTSPIWQARLRALFFLTLITLMLCAQAHAGSDTTFDTWVDEIEGWVTGSLGKGVSICMVLIGIIGSISRGSLMPIATGVGCALGLNYAPTIISSLFTAVL